MALENKIGQGYCVLGSYTSLYIYGHKDAHRCTAIHHRPLHFINTHTGSYPIHLQPNLPSSHTVLSPIATGSILVDASHVGGDPVLVFLYRLLVTQVSTGQDQNTIGTMYVFIASVLTSPVWRDNCPLIRHQ